MTEQTNVTEGEQLLQRLARNDPQARAETSLLASAGSGAAAWTVKVKSNYSYNVYNVRAVEVGEPGSLPAEYGQQMQAVNLAESFTQQGQLPTGKFVIICRVGEKNYFYAPV